MLTEHDARELQEAKQWLADRLNGKQYTHHYVKADIFPVDAQTLLDYHADRIKGVAHE